MKQSVWLAAPLAVALALGVLSSVGSAQVHEVSSETTVTTADFSGYPSLKMSGGTLSYTGTSSSTIGDGKTVSFDWGTGGTIDVKESSVILSVDKKDASGPVSIGELYKTGSGDLHLTGNNYYIGTLSGSDSGSLHVPNGDLFINKAEIVGSYTGTVSASGTIGINEFSTLKGSDITDSFTFYIKGSSYSLGGLSCSATDLAGHLSNPMIKADVNDFFSNDDYSTNVTMDGGRIKATTTRRK